MAHAWHHAPTAACGHNRARGSTDWSMSPLSRHVTDPTPPPPCVPGARCTPAAWPGGGGTHPHPPTAKSGAGACTHTASARCDPQARCAHRLRAPVHPRSLPARACCSSTQRCQPGPWTRVGGGKAGGGVCCWLAAGVHSGAPTQPRAPPCDVATPRTAGRGAAHAMCVPLLQRWTAGLTRCCARSRAIGWTARSSGWTTASARRATSASPRSACSCAATTAGSAGACSARRAHKTSYSPPGTAWTRRGCACATIVRTTSPEMRMLSLRENYAIPHFRTQLSPDHVKNRAPFCASPTFGMLGTQVTE